MRRSLTALMLATLTLLAPTVAPAAAQPAPPPCPSFDNVTEPITVRVGERFSVGLESNRTTGYGWALDVSNLRGIAGVGPSYTPMPPPQPPGSVPVVGSGGQECFSLTPSISGTFTLSFSYRRPFEPATTPPARTKQITVIVVPTGAPVQIPRAALPDETPG
jgi:predicted secreted protein